KVHAPAANYLQGCRLRALPADDLDGLCDVAGDDVGLSSSRDAARWPPVGSHHPFRRRKPAPRLRRWPRRDDRGRRLHQAAERHGRGRRMSRILTRRRLLTTGLGAIAGASGLAVAARLADRYGLIPPDHGGLYGSGETLTYASQRLLTARGSL